MIVVTGATGNVGGEVTGALIAAGAPVRAVARAGREDAVPAGATPVIGDLNEPETLAPAVDGASGLFLLPGYPGIERLLELARDGGVRHVVLLSGASAGSGDQSNAITRYMIASERAVRESGLAWTILRPSMFATNSLEWVNALREGDVVTAPFADIRAAVIDPADIGAVAAHALTTDGHAGQTYRLTGPEALTPADRLAVLADLLGRDLTLRSRPNDEARVVMEAALPQEYVDAFFDFYVAGNLDESPVLPTVPDLLGRPARTFRDWATAHLDAFR
ncbi:uncharacterized protein YbjT (DUF2867 family) [Herbihabitans rhizosphaerae]|uniref:Uncharacterized protein YbjT (DUF2867 family) n=1 Tax=Herbihabitans rhizosphaerae TaxID=1872711 RepID=A0A4V2ER76_9PSEU|nr:NAD(P)H-binding protein [Herbihabitans rhizosphaerae]RZS29461.1 uncharacterized protein YbjT (DUF2867 family) [Herbihabitans rhizosphaerae]